MRSTTVERPEGFRNEEENKTIIIFYFKKKKKSNVSFAGGMYIDSILDVNGE